MTREQAIELAVRRVIVPELSWLRQWKRHFGRDFIQIPIPSTIAAIRTEFSRLMAS